MVRATIDWSLSGHCPLDVMTAKFHSGFIAIVGRPNVGKSTLLNYLAEAKVAIVTDKPQTTRHTIRGVINRKNAQIVFLDTPGFHKPQHRLGEKLNEKVRLALGEIDLVLLLLDGESGVGSGDAYLAKKILESKAPVVIGLNKADAIEETEIEGQIQKARELGIDAPIFEISALNGAGVKRLVDYLIECLPEGPKYYPDGMISDQPEFVVMAEIIREKLMSATREEIPHSVAVVIEEASPRASKEIIDVEAMIYVERESQKGIVIGKDGVVLKKVGQQARMEIERLLGNQVNLQLWVKVRKDWRDSESNISRFGY